MKQKTQELKSEHEAAPCSVRTRPAPLRQPPAQGRCGRRAAEGPRAPLRPRGSDPALLCFPPTVAIGSRFGHLGAGTLGFN